MHQGGISMETAAEEGNCLLRKFCLLVAFPTIYNKMWLHINIKM
jgi:hypothetical protein